MRGMRKPLSRGKRAAARVLYTMAWGDPKKKKKTEKGDKSK